ncbi:ABC transporter permease subunit [Paenibacillus glycanilyticus]|uniref:ABC transporter permease n=1 Tax=Paenibacillus glycanilyticus TaxID=126569 RepID=UPI00203FFB3C|nr:ABC transporter permease subunit [Paenibacillus glycanilyticus]MCM3626904.1 ABC transporter permease subunit [Paenibacillus glycanilyticus]
MEGSSKVLDVSPLWKHVRKEWKLYSFLVLPIIYFLIFKYAPMIGNVIAFRKYRGGPNFLGTEWVGLQYFRMFMKDPTFWRAFWNNIFLSVAYLVVRFPLTLIFALLINEIRRLKLKKFVQTVSYLPHFISMVIVAGMVKEMLSASGPINALLMNFGMDPIPFISLPQWFPAIYISSGIWQGLGWGTILYLAAMTGINTELYEAARIDGASRLRLAWHVTIPGILPTIMTLLILDIGGIMGSNFEKVLLLYNPLTYESADVISTYVYRMGITGGNFSFATAVGLFEGVIGLILVTMANTISKKTTKSSLW